VLLLTMADFGGDHRKRDRLSQRQRLFDDPHSNRLFGFLFSSSPPRVLRMEPKRFLPRVPSRHPC
jgi:hypothetical protein